MKASHPTTARELAELGILRRTFNPVVRVDGESESDLPPPELADVQFGVVDSSVDFGEASNVE